MTDQQQFFDGRELWASQVPYYEPDIVSGGSRTLIHVGLWRARLSLVADAVLSPVTHVGVANQKVNVKLRASASVVPA